MSICNFINRIFKLTKFDKLINLCEVKGSLARFVFICMTILFGTAFAEDKPDPKPAIIPFPVIPIPSEEEHQRLINPAQKIADDPKDRRVEIKIGSGTFCYVPTFSKGEGYWYANYCGSGTIWGRYDVFQRIAFNVHSKWVCITAPDNVTGYESGKIRSNWDYAVIRPCVLNNPNQRWQVKDNAFYTLDGQYRLQDYYWYLVVAKPSKMFSQHTIADTMNEWLHTVAKPPTLTMKTFLAWSFIDRYQWALYYVSNNRSYADLLVPMYYNTENGHVAQYYPDSGTLYCIKSNNGNNDWNWVSWENCNDDIPKNKDSLYFEPISMVGNAGALADKDGNLLRVAQYGYNWGVPYTAKRSYLKADTKSSPKSFFSLSPDMDSWNRFKFGNVGDNLTYCPSPGKHKFFNNERVAYAESKYDIEKAQIKYKERFKNGSMHPDDSGNPPMIKPIKDQVPVLHKDNIPVPHDKGNYPVPPRADANDMKPMPVQATPGVYPKIKLPPTFVLTESWIQRLYAIATSADGSAPAIGICGVCLLHTFQMMAELNNNYLVPPSMGGFYFDVMPRSNPILSFRNRYPELASRVEDTVNLFDIPLRVGETQSSRFRRIIHSISVAMMARNSWAVSNMAENISEVRDILSSLFLAPVGTMWHFTILRDTPSGTLSGHSQPLIRMPDGIISVPTNAPNFTMETFREQLTPLRSVDDIMNVLTIGGTRNIILFGVFRLLGPYDRTIDEVMSVNNCSGDGPNRRGNTRLPSSSLINQCLSGRCSIQ